MGNSGSREVAEQRDKTEVVLSGRDLAELPVQIGKLRVCRSLDVSNNKLSAVPVELGPSGAAPVQDRPSRVRRAHPTALAQCRAEQAR